MHLSQRTPVVMRRMKMNSLRTRKASRMHSRVLASYPQKNGRKSVETWVQLSIKPVNSIRHWSICAVLTVWRKTRQLRRKSTKRFNRCAPRNAQLPPISPGNHSLTPRWNRNTSSGREQVRLRFPPGLPHLHRKEHSNETAHQSRSHSSHHRLCGGRLGHVPVFRRQATGPVHAGGSAPHHTGKEFLRPSA